MENLTPSEVILFRAECYRNMDGKGVFSLYSEKSEMCRLFSEDAFEEHFFKHVKDTSHAGLKIVNEKSRGSLAEVNYIEYIHAEGNLITYYSKSAMVSEDGRWKILKEMREIKKQPVGAASE